MLLQYTGDLFFVERAFICSVSVLLMLYLTIFTFDFVWPSNRRLIPELMEPYRFSAKCDCIVASVEHTVLSEESAEIMAAFLVG